MDDLVSDFHALPPEDRALALQRAREILASIPGVRLPGVEASVSQQKKTALLTHLELIAGGRP
jgi:hypothetical protein